MTRRAAKLSAGSPRYALYGMSVMAAFMSVMPGCSFVKHVSQAPAFETRTDELSVLTFNVYGFPLLEQLQRPERFADIKEELTTSLAAVDVVMLQEAFIPTTRVLREARQNAFGGACADASAFNPTGLVLLSDHDAIGAVSSFAFVQGDDGQWGMRAERDLDCAALSARRKPHKGMMSLTLATPRGPVDVVNVHLDVDPGARHQQKRLIADFLRARQSERPLVLAGDLNEDTCKAERGGLFGGLLKLAGASCGVGPTVGGLRLGMIQGAVLPAEIDSVYVCGATPTDKRMRLFSSPRRGGHLSDHDGVLALVRIDDDEGARACQ